MTEKVWITLIHDVSALIALLGVVGLVIYLIRYEMKGGGK